MTWQKIANIAVAHPVFFIIIPGCIVLQLALVFVAFRTCSCEECGKPFGIWRCRDQVLELCYGCYRQRLRPRRKIFAARRERQTVSAVRSR